MVKCGSFYILKNYYYNYHKDNNSIKSNFLHNSKLLSNLAILQRESPHWTISLHHLLGIGGLYYIVHGGCIANLSHQLVCLYACRHLSRRGSSRSIIALLMERVYSNYHFGLVPLLNL